MKLTITVPAPCAWANSNQRLHRMAQANLTKQWREAGFVAARGLDQLDPPVRILAHIWKPRRGRYDPMNLWPSVKGAIDGMVSAGLLKDDDHLHVIGPDMRHGGIGPAAIVFTFEPATPAPSPTD